MASQTLHDRLVSRLYWPCLAATLAAMVIPPVGVWIAIDPHIIQMLTIAFCAVTACNFLLILTDGETRTAIEDLCTILRDNRENWTFGDYFLMKAGDLLFLICHRLMWIELFLLLFAPRNLWYLWFAGFGIATTMLVLSLKKDDFLALTCQTTCV